MRAIDRKLLRDLAGIKAQAAAIAAVILCGVATYIMFIATLDSLHATRDDFYRNYRFADVFLTLERAPERTAARIRAMPGVNAVQTRVLAWANLDVAGFPEPVQGLIVSVPETGQPALNALYLNAGRRVEPRRDDEVVVSDAFAAAHGLHAGDTLQATIKGKREALTIVGTAQSPEFIHQLRPGGIFPDYKRFGVMWMGREAVAEAYDMDGAFNDVVLGLAPGANAEDVIDRLDDLFAPYGGLGAYAREDQRSHRFLAEELQQLQAMSEIFPVLFLGVAAFLLNVVISRLVGLQREQIASLKAFGYGNGAVMAHYLKLVLLIVLAGVAGGVALGVWLGELLAGVYRNFFSFPYLVFQLSPRVVLEAAVASALAAALGTAFAVRRAAALRPAEAMRPAPPARYRQSLVERAGLGRWLAAPSRMILRNIGRHPVKALLTVAGIAVATGITMTGRFQQDTVDYMLDVQYGMQRREDVSVAFTEPTSWGARYGLRALPGVRHVEVFRDVAVIMRHEQRSERTGIRGLEPGGDLIRPLDADLSPVHLPAEGVVLTDFLGEALGVRPGDTLTVEVMEGARPVKRLTVAALVKEYLGVTGYMRLDALNRFMDEGHAISGGYMAVDDAARPALLRELKAVPRVSGVVQREHEIANFNETMDETLIFYTSIASVFSVIIAFGVIYNSARIALAERDRELASLRVLGFTRGEISYILLGELGLLTLAALPAGMLAGRGLCWMIARNLQNDLYRVPLILESSTYAFAVLVVLVSAVVSGLVVRRRLDELDLIGVLKTKE